MIFQSQGLSAVVEDILVVCVRMFLYIYIYINIYINIFCMYEFYCSGEDGSYFFMYIDANFVSVLYFYYGSL